MRVVDARRVAAAALIVGAGVHHRRVAEVGIPAEPGIEAVAEAEAPRVGTTVIAVAAGVIRRVVRPVVAAVAAVVIRIVVATAVVAAIGIGRRPDAIDGGPSRRTITARTAPVRNLARAGGVVVVGVARRGSVRKRALPPPLALFDPDPAALPDDRGTARSPLPPPPEAAAVRGAAC